MKTLGKCMRLVLGFLAIGIPLSEAAPVVLDFEGHAAMGYVQGTVVSETAKLFDDYLDEHGIVFFSGDSHVAVVRLGSGHATSGVNGIGGSKDGKLYYKPDIPVCAAFFNPVDISQKASTDFVSVRTDLWPSASRAEMTLEAYNTEGELIATISAADSGGVTLSISTPGIHTVKFSGLYVALDDFTFNPVVPAGEQPVPEIGVAPASFMDQRVVAGNVLMHTMNITNAGNAALEFSFCSSRPGQDEDLIAYFPFNGNASDESGNGHDGHVSGALLAEDRFGNADSAYDFNGTSDHINCGNIMNGLEAFTVSAWVNIDSFTDAHYMGPWSQTLQVDSYSRALVGAYSMYTTSNTIGGFGTVMRFEPYANVVNTRVGYVLPIGEWCLVTQTYDGSDIREYHNGKLVNTTHAGSYVFGSPWDFLIGQTAAYPNSRLRQAFFDGRIDDVRIYKRALSEAELLNLYTETDNAPCTIPDWLGVEPASGAIAPGGSMEVILAMSAGGMVAGDYASYDLSLGSNDPAMPSVFIPVSMWVLPPAPVMNVEPEYTAWKSNEVFWRAVDGPVMYWTEAYAIEHCSPGKHGDSFIPKGWANVQLYHDPNRWMQQSGWIDNTTWVFEDLRLNTRYQYRVKASVETEVGLLESSWSDWVESCQVPVVKHIDENRVPDEWKQKYFGSAGNFKGLVDSDGDGLCDYDEFVVTSDPFEKESSFKVKSCKACERGHLVLSWRAVPDRLYSVYWTPAVGESFQLLEGGILYPRNSYTTDVFSAGSSGFFKVGVQLVE